MLSSVLLPKEKRKLGYPHVSPLPSREKRVEKGG